MQKRESMSADFLRQRRNLLIVTMTLLTIDLAGATFKGEVSILGAGILFREPDRIVSAAWILWLYFFVRYFQYFNEEPDLGIRAAMETWLHQRYGEASEYDNTHRIQWRSWWRWKMFESLGDPSSDEDWAWVARKHPILTALLTLRAFFHVAAVTPRFTDYWLPPLFALLPVGLIGWRRAPSGWEWVSAFAASFSGS